MLNRRKKSAKSILFSKHSTNQMLWHLLSTTTKTFRFMNRNKNQQPPPKTKYSLASNSIFSVDFSNWSLHPKAELCDTDKALPFEFCSKFGLPLYKAKVFPKSESHTLPEVSLTLPLSPNGNVQKECESEFLNTFMHSNLEN